MSDTGLNNILNGCSANLLTDLDLSETTGMFALIKFLPMDKDIYNAKYYGRGDGEMAAGKIKLH